MEKERALATARNPMMSKYGSMLIRRGTQEERLLSSSVQTLERQMRKHGTSIDMEKKLFIEKHSSREPLIIVERSPPEDVVRRFNRRKYREEGKTDTYAEDKAKGRLPRYMRPIQSRESTLDMRPTLDVFRVRTKKKVNLWEEADLERHGPTFQSTARPSWPLTLEEIDDLKKGRDLHRMLPTDPEDELPEQSGTLVPLDIKPKKTKRRRKRAKKMEPLSRQHDDLDDHIRLAILKEAPNDDQLPYGAFITEPGYLETLMGRKNYRSSSKSKGRSSKKNDFPDGSRLDKSSRINGVSVCEAVLTSSSDDDETTEE